MNTEFKSIRARLAALAPEMIELQRNLTRLPALAPENGGTGEEAKARFLISYLQELHFGNIDVFKAPDNRVPSGFRPNILFSVPGKYTDRSLFIISHMDVVPPGDLNTWESDPHEPLIFSDRIVGRGVEDNQQGIVSSIFAARVIKELDLAPALNVKLLFVSDEETGSKMGLKFLLANHPYLFKQDDLFLVPDYGNEDGTMIEIAEKSILWVKVSIKGKQCHASAPHKGRNTLRATGHFIVQSQELFSRFSDKDSNFNPPSSTFEPTKKEANVENINTIPGHDVLYFDCRALPHYSLDSVVGAFKSLADKVGTQWGVSIKIETEMAEQAPPATPKDSPIVVSLVHAIKELRKLEARPCGIGGVTVAAYLRKHGYNVAVWQTITKTAHQPNEYCLFENMIKDAEVMAYLMLNA